MKIGSFDDFLLNGVISLGNYTYQWGGARGGGGREGRAEAGGPRNGGTIN